jgi:hypothetical protein
MFVCSTVLQLDTKNAYKHHAVPLCAVAVTVTVTVTLQPVLYLPRTHRTVQAAPSFVTVAIKMQAVGPPRTILSPSHITSAFVFHVTGHSNRTGPDRLGLQYRGIPTGQHLHPPLATRLTHTASCAMCQVAGQRCTLTTVQCRSSSCMEQYLHLPHFCMTWC